MKTNKLILFTSLLLPGVPFWYGHAQSALQPSNPTGSPVDTSANSVPGRRLVIELEVPAPVGEVWKAFTTSEGLATWLAPQAQVDLRPGGDWIVSFPGGKSTAGGTIVSFVPQSQLVLSALAPDQFPHVRSERTRAVFDFEPRGYATLVRLTQTGWKTGDEWDRAYEYLIAGNAQLMSTLHRRFAFGPIDWEKLAGGN